MTHWACQGTCRIIASGAGGGQGGPLVTLCWTADGQTPALLRKRGLDMDPKPSGRVLRFSNETWWRAPSALHGRVIDGA